MTRDASLRLFYLLLLSAFLGACGDSAKQKQEVLPAGKHRVLIRFTTKALQGLDAQYKFSRQGPATPLAQQSAGQARDNATEELDAGIQDAGDVNFVEISFRAITPTSSVKPQAAASYAVEVLVDGAVKTRVVIDAKSQLNNNYYLAAVAVAEIK